MNCSGLARGVYLKPARREARFPLEGNETMTDYVDYGAARERLLALTTDSAIIDRLMGLRQADKSAQLCLGAFRDAGLSLDHILHGIGKPQLQKKERKP